MIAINGIYQNGIIQLEKKVNAKKTIRVIVTFLDEEVEVISKRLSLKDFSFTLAREKSKDYKGSFSDAIIEERKAER